MRLFKNRKRIYVKTVIVKKKRIYITVLSMVITICLFYVVSGLLAPYVLELAKNEVRLRAVKYINDSVLDVLGSTDFDYEDIVTVDKDSNGKVISLSGDAVKMNILKSLIVDEITKKITSSECEIYVSVPVIHIFGNSLFASSSPMIKVQVLPLENLYVDFESKFESGGVNQTRHDIYIKTKIDYTVLTPAGKIKDTVSTSVLVAQTVVIGDVPDSYINIQSEEGELKSDVLDLAP